MKFFNLTEHENGFCPWFLLETHKSKCVHVCENVSNISKYIDNKSNCAYHHLASVIPLETEIEFGSTPKPTIITPSNQETKKQTTWLKTKHWLSNRKKRNKSTHTHTQTLAGWWREENGLKHMLKKKTQNGVNNRNKWNMNRSQINFNIFRASELNSSNAICIWHGIFCSTWSHHISEIYWNVPECLYCCCSYCWCWRYCSFFSRTHVYEFILHCWA